MVILHYIPPKNACLKEALQITSLLQTPLGKAVETHIINEYITRKRFVQLLFDTHADIVHIHGCWSYNAAQIERWCNTRGIPVVVSPHGQLSQSVILTDLWKKKLPRIIAYQFLTIHKSYIVHATTAMELSEIQELGWRRRISFIPLTGAPEKTIQMFLDLYGKIINTEKRNHLPIRETDYLYSLLKVYADNDSPSYNSDEATELAAKLRNLPANSWTELVVYATDHGVLPLIEKACETLNVHIPVDKTMPIRFKARKSLKQTDASRHEQRIINESSIHPAESDIALKIEQLYNLTERHVTTDDNTSTPLLLITELYRILHNTNYDEIIINELTSHRRKYAARIMQILADAFRLTIGFMFIDPIDDLQTEKIRKAINNLP